MDESIKYGKTIPLEYHEALFVGQLNRAGKIIDYKHSPVVINSALSLEEYKNKIFGDHIPAVEVPLVYMNPEPFMVLRPTALGQDELVDERLRELGLSATRVLKIDGFMKFADTIYDLDQTMSFTWKWRALMLGLHDTSIHNQNLAKVYFFNSSYLANAEQYQDLVEARGLIREEIGNTPYLFFHDDKLEFGMDLHHLHIPDMSDLLIEFNLLMHAINKTSIFSG